MYNFESWTVKKPELEGIDAFELWCFLGFPGGTEVKVSACHAGDLDLIPGSGRLPGDRNGNPLQYSCLENPWTEESGGLRLSDFTFFSFFLWISGRSKSSVLKEINPNYSFERLMLKFPILWLLDANS